VKWEASRIRDHLKQAHKSAADRLSLTQYAARFKEYIVGELRKFMFKERPPAAPLASEAGNTEEEEPDGYSPEAWRQLFRRKHSATERVACPYCNREFNRSSLNRHIDRFHVAYARQPDPVYEAWRRGEFNRSSLNKHIDRFHLGSAQGGQRDRVCATAEIKEEKENDVNCVIEGDGGDAIELEIEDSLAFLEETSVKGPDNDVHSELRSHSRCDSGGGNLRITKIPPPSAVKGGHKETHTRPSHPTYVLDHDTGEILVVESVEAALRIMEADR
jgi:hypothetical protein